jgi:hypothetical protein
MKNPTPEKSMYHYTIFESIVQMDYVDSHIVNSDCASTMLDWNIKFKRMAI